MKTLRLWFYKIFLHHKLKVQTFTYYLPAPPPRKSGYREKEFDRIFSNFVNQGYEVLSINTQSNPCQTSPGLWIIATVRGTTPKSVYSSEDEFDIKSEEEPIEGIYYIDDE